MKFQVFLAASLLVLSNSNGYAMNDGGKTERDGPFSAAVRKACQESAERCQENAKRIAYYEEQARQLAAVGEIQKEVTQRANELLGISTWLKELEKEFNEADHEATVFLLELYEQLDECRQRGGDETQLQAQIEEAEAERQEAFARLERMRKETDPLRETLRQAQLAEMGPLRRQVEAFSAIVKRSPGKSRPSGV